MSRYMPPVVDESEISIAEAPFWGGEYAAYLSYDEVLKVGDFIMSAAGAGAFSASKINKVSNGGVASVEVTNAGADYTSAPTVAFAAPPAGGVQATGTAVVEDGAVTGITITNPGKGYLVPPTIGFADGGGTGAAATASLVANDLQVQVVSTLRSAVACVLTVSGKDASGADLTGTATFTPPSYVENRTFNFQNGYTVDVIPQTEGKQFISITGIAVVGGSKGARFNVNVLPALDSYELIGVTNEKDFTSPSRIAKSIADGMKSNAYSKKGRNAVGNLTITAKHKNHADGLARFDGERCTAMLVGLKEDQVVVERVIFAGFQPTCDRKNPDGDSEAMLDGKGDFEEVMYLLAP